MEVQCKILFSGSFFAELYKKNRIFRFNFYWKCYLFKVLRFSIKFLHHNTEKPI